MSKVKNLWVARDKGCDSLNLFVEKPYCLDGEWISNQDDEIIEIDDSFLDRPINYEDGPKQIYLTVSDE